MVPALNHGIVEDYLNPWLIILVITGAVNMVAGFILWKFPPRKINWLYGYRTARSMKSQESWDFAQPYAGKELIRQGVLMSLIGLPGPWLPLKPVMAAFLSIPVMLALLGVLLYRTEKALKERFG